MDVLLSIDLGTTGCKAAVYTAAGTALGACYLEYPLLRLQAGVVEQDARQWWVLAQEALRGALRQAGASGKQVRALGISTQGISFVPVDAAGEPLRNAISWLDTRATAEAAEIGARVDDDALFCLTGKRPAAYYVLPKLLWLQRHEPDVVRRAARFLLAQDYLLLKLCGVACTDYSLAGGTLLLDLQRLDWSDELLGLAGIERNRLPGLAWAGTLGGGLLPEAAGALGLPAGLPVAVGGQDQKCAALGAGIRPGRVTVSLGTAAAISCLVDRPALDPLRRIPVFPFVAPGTWDLEGVVGTAGAALKWARDTLFAGRSYAELDGLAADSPPGANGVRFYPHLAGGGSPNWRANARGAFTGLSLASGPGDIVRSILEGVAFQVRANLEVIDTLASRPAEELALFGGGAQSALWAEIICQVTALPVRVPPAVDVANWGACILAGYGAGLFAQRLAPGLAASGARAHLPDAAAVARYSDIYNEYGAEGVGVSGERSGGQDVQQGLGQG